MIPVRLAALHAVRGAIGLVALVAALGWPGNGGHGGAIAALAYLGAVVALEFVRRTDAAALVADTGLVVVLDATYLTIAIDTSGHVRPVITALAVVLIAGIVHLLSAPKGLALAGLSASALVVVGVLGPALAPHGAHLPTAATALAPAVLVIAAIIDAAIARLAEAGFRVDHELLEARMAFGTGLGQARTQPEILTRLATHVRDRLGFGRVAVLVRHRDGWLGIRATPHTVEAVHTPSPGGPIVASVWQSHAVILRHLPEDALLDTVLPLAMNVAVVGLHDDTGPVGLVIAEWDSADDSVPARAVAALGEAAGHAALAVRNAELLTALRELSTRDPLTGLANRRLFDETLIPAFGVARRATTPLSLLALDVDDFKVVNDRYGHPVGDEVLRQIARCIQRHTASTDLVARVGGDEFVVLLPGCSGIDADTVATRITERVATTVDAAPVSVSIGRATLDAAMANPAALLDAADVALYEQKRQRPRRGDSGRQLPVVPAVTPAGSGPVAAGRAGSAPQADQEPVNSAVDSTPATSHAKRS